MLQKSRRSPKLFSDFNPLSFASVMAIVMFVVLVRFMTAPTPHFAIAADVSKAQHPVSVPNALREDAMKVTITRDGMIFFGADRASPEDLPRRFRNA